MVLALAVVLGAAAAWLVRASTAGPAQGGYSQRIDFERPSDPLPDRPGTLAATIYDNDFGDGRSLGVGPDGQLWEIPATAVSLSPSGTLLLSQRFDRQRQVVVDDLVSGDEVVLRNVGRGWSMQDERVVWSPDERGVLTVVGPTPRPRLQRTAVVDVATGEATPVGQGAPAGFRSSTEAVTVVVDDERLIVTTTDLGSGRATDLVLRLDGPWEGDPDGVPAAGVAPDGSTLLVVEFPETADWRSGPATARLFSLEDGSELPSRRFEDWDGCAPRWVGADPVMPTSSMVHGSSRAASAMRLTPDGPERLVAVHPRLQSSCLQLTAAALEAGPRWTLFGTSTALWTWYWFPALVAIGLALAGLLLLVRAVRRTSRRAATPPGSP